MAGGKETPRQKMIGMMYLVLTALLALNVSKAILDAFVAIEENIQISNLNEYGRGEEKRSDLKEVAEDKTAPDVQKKAKKLLEVVDKIDKMTAEQIKMIDDMKSEILTTCGEDIAKTGEGAIIVTPYNAKEPLRPARMNLMHVEGKDKYDEPMLVMGIAEDLKNPSGNGKKLWDSYNKYRTDLTELIAASSSTPEKKYSFKDPKINKYKDFKDLKSQLEKSLKTAAPDDQEAMIKIYQSLTKQERVKMEENEEGEVHWIGKTFDHSPSVAALASLSSLQKEILTARADAVALVRGRVGGGEYSFNKIMALAYGPEVANQNEEVEVQVLMAAFDSDKQPIVTVNGGALRETKEGKGFVTVKGAGAEINLTGTITILNKSGIPKTLPWEKTIQIMKPQGNVSLPELNVLYKGYPNVISAVASGYPEAKVNGQGVTLSKKGENYIGMVSGASKTASISISGFNKQTKKTVSLGTFTFKVKNLPPPNIYFGAVADGGKASKAETRIFAKYGDEIPLTANFTVVSWEMQVAGLSRPSKGSGNNLTAEAIGQLKQAKPGAMISFMTQVKGPDGILRKKSGNFTI
ncbi:MAG: hypothetical protein IT221_08990 [Fluviicola sp.]|jgi:SepF-like predicted cell division protein (DUF552 family)|nr:hypothetical protein [Fluviicola sp.]